MSDKNKILVFIPAYRCENQIIRVLNQFDAQTQEHVHTVMIVDNGSPDDTLNNAVSYGKNHFKNCDFVAWLNENNYGLGGSHKAAFSYAVENDFDYLIVLHGDDQADFKDILPYIKNGDHHKHDCLLGARFMKGSQLMGYSKFRTFGNRVYNKLFSCATFKNICDLGSGLNLYKLKAFHEFYYKTFPDDLTFNYVMLLSSYYRKQDVKFFPISWREDDQISNVRLFRQAFKVLKILLGFIVFRGAFLKDDMRVVRFEKYTGAIVFSRKK